MSFKQQIMISQWNIKQGKLIYNAIDQFVNQMTLFKEMIVLAATKVEDRIIINQIKRVSDHEFATLLSH